MVQVAGQQQSDQSSMTLKPSCNISEDRGCNFTASVALCIDVMISASGRVFL